MRGRFFVHPVFLEPGCAISSWDFANRTWLIFRTGCRTVAERLLPVAFLLGIPLVDGHFHRHPGAPDAAVAETLVGAGVESAMPPRTIGRQIGWHTKPGRRRTRRGGWHTLDFRRLVVVDSFQVRIRDRFDFRRETSPGAKTELRMGCRANSNPHLFSVGGTFD